ncbi:MAG: MADF domain-containing protein [Candidatus Omnitrophica bacterium]|nr:MADF domain-containing protein [Candidatus Omnitrophota bacterium]
MSWTQEATFQLINEYQNHPCLWEVASVDYKNRILKAQAWNAVAEKVDRGVEEVQRKVHNLRNQFSSELKKMSTRSGQGTDQTYTSGWKYEVRSRSFQTFFREAVIIVLDY